MAIPAELLEDALTKIQRLCACRVDPENDGHRLTVTADDNTITIVDEQPP